MSIADELKSRNFSIYGQWTGIICIILCIALGIANIFHFGVIIAFSIVCLISGLLLIFVEIPLLLRVCPTSAKFDEFVRRFAVNWMRALLYVCLSVIQFASIAISSTSLIAAAVVLLIAAIFYGLAAAMGQGFVGSKTLGGQGVAEMIV